MIQDVVKVFTRGSVSINAMEVLPGQIFIKFNLNDKCTNQVFLKAELLKQRDVLQVAEIDLLPCEQKEKEIEAVLEATNEGILGIDAEGTVKYINSAAAGLLHLDLGNCAGRKIRQIIGPNIPILEMLRTGQPYNHQEIMIETPRGMLHYLSSGCTIRDEKGRIIGAVATLKSMTAARELVNTITKSQVLKFNDIVHDSPAMGQVIDLAKKVAAGDYTILIRGESGTGKELFARAIHDTSPRRDKPFVPINCAALPEALLESELFGYEEGAFSGAKKGGKIGLFEAAHQGTLFLDEIGELSLILQGKLLRTIQEGLVRRVGGNRQISVDVRILAASNRNIEELVGAKQFRQDLYYRINVFPLHIPALRQRPEDIPVLIRHFCIQYCSELNKQIEFTDEAVNSLINYSWPGNVRELQNVVLRTVHLTDGKQIKPRDLLINNESVIKKNEQASECATLKQALGREEKNMLETALNQYGSARSAAKNLGLSHTAVLKKIHRHNLKHLLKTQRNSHK